MNVKQSVKESELLSVLAKEIRDLKTEFEQLKLIDSYSEDSQQGWKQDIARLIKMKESIPRIEEIMARIKII